MVKWVTDFISKRLCRELTGKEYRIDDQHNVLIMLHDNFFEAYIMWHDDQGHSSPFLYMFGTPKGSMPYSEIVDMVCTVAPDYYRLFEED